MSCFYRSIVVDYLEKKFQQEHGVAIVYVYCNCKEQGESYLDNLISSLLQQLVQKKPNISATIEELYNRGFVVSRTENYWQYKNSQRYWFLKFPASIRSSLLSMLSTNISETLGVACYKKLQSYQVEWPTACEYYCSCPLQDSSIHLMLKEVEELWDKRDRGSGA